jgi:hypothetical protein
MTFFEYMRTRDPNYGSQAHQHRMVERMDEMQALAPCNKDHSSEAFPTHTHRCYPRDVVDSVVVRQIQRDRAKVVQP